MYLIPSRTAIYSLSSPSKRKAAIVVAIANSCLATRSSSLPTQFKLDNSTMFFRHTRAVGRTNKNPPDNLIACSCLLPSFFSFLSPRHNNPKEVEMGRGEQDILDQLAGTTSALVQGVGMSRPGQNLDSPLFQNCSSSAGKACRNV